MAQENGGSESSVTAPLPVSQPDQPPQRADQITRSISAILNRRRSPSSETLLSNAPSLAVSNHSALPVQGGAVLSPPPVSTSHIDRQPARSFFHSSFHNRQDNELAPHYSSVGVRDQTAELANKALSDLSSSYKTTSSRLQPPLSQARLSDNIPSASLGDGASRITSRRFSVPATEQLQEVSEPSSLENLPSINGSQESLRSKRMKHESNLTHLLRTSPPESFVANPNVDDVAVEEEEPASVQRVRSPEEQRLLTPTKSSEQPGVASHGYGTVGDDVEAQNGNARRTSHPPKRITKYLGFKRINTVEYLKQKIAAPKKWNKKDVAKAVFLDPVTALPAVMVGLLLNILDGLSYGMILFPLGEPIFSKLGPDGLNMFYVSCIISQLVYSCGGSVFKGGIGSEMIEVVPFFHKMAFVILKDVGTDNPKAVVATTILAFCMSSVITGLVFWLLGTFRMGALIGFFPRHILLGCIGGVGWFLMATGVEVCARLDGSLNYDLETLNKLVEPDTLVLWTIPLCLAAILMVLQSRIKSSMLTPIYFMLVPIVFHIVVAAVPRFTLEDLRSRGWVFDAVEDDVPFYHFYTLFDFHATDWTALFKCIPAMIALTFFGIIHVPINVPALGVSLQVDNVDVDRELKAHGVSNALSGLFGSIQNYLVYTNSILFIKSGGNSRLAGIMLAFATAGIWMVGPVVIGYIPIMMVGALIFLLGMDLLREALVETWGRVHQLEYATMVIIVVVMGAYDFVVGIVVGIVCACFGYVVQTSQKSPIRGSFSGVVARSTVRRHPIQQRYLKKAGIQIHVTRMAGPVFFGTIAQVEKQFRELVGDAAFSKNPIRYLIIDLAHVTSMDFSAAEGFTRVSRMLSAKGVLMVLAGVQSIGDVGRGLKAVGVWGNDELNEEDKHIMVFEDLNSALEFCENELLKAFYAQRDALAADTRASPGGNVPRDAPKVPNPGYSIDNTTFGSPRRSHLHQLANATLKGTGSPDMRGSGPPPFMNPAKWKNFKQPLPLILSTFQEMTDYNEDFWYKATEFFQRREYAGGTVLYRRGDAPGGFYLLESGVFRAEYGLEQGRYHESIVAGTTCGELPFFSDTPRTATVYAETDSVAWVLDEDNWNKLREKYPEVSEELLRVSLKLTSERLESITSYVLTTSG